MHSLSKKSLLTVATLALVCPCAGQDTLSYKARETDRTVELSTPYGARQVIGDVGSDTGRYRIEIPLESLKPTPAPITPKNDAQADEASDLARDISGDKDKDPAAKKKKKTAMGGDGTGKGDEPDDDDEPNELGETPVKRNPRKHLPSPVDPGYEYDDSDRLVVEANHLFNHGKYYEATLYVEELIRKKPTYVKGWVMKGSLMWVQGYKDLARNAWQQALALEPDNNELKDLLTRYK